MIVEEGGKNKYISTEEAFKGKKDADKWIAEVVLDVPAFLPEKFPIWPLANVGEEGISSYFGLRKDPFTGKEKMHGGLDIAAPEGTPVLAVVDGVVSEIGSNNVYGNYIVLDHGQNDKTKYAHLESVPIIIENRKVRKGTIIGRVGTTGKSTGPHLHFEYIVDGVRIDPGHMYMHGSVVLNEGD